MESVDLRVQFRSENPDLDVWEQLIKTKCGAVPEKQIFTLKEQGNISSNFTKWVFGIYLFLESIYVWNVWKQNGWGGRGGCGSRGRSRIFLTSLECTKWQDGTFWSVLQSGSNQWEIKNRKKEQALGGGLVQELHRGQTSAASFSHIRVIICPCWIHMLYVVA